jgi:hypothetical protein
MAPDCDPVRLAGQQAVTRGLVDAPRGQQQAVGPQAHARITRLTGEGFTLRRKPLAQAQAACLGFHQQHAQLRDAGFGGGRGLVARLHQEHAAERDAIGLGDPGRFACRVEAFDEVGGDARHQGLEAHVPAVLLRVQRAVA